MLDIFTKFRIIYSGVVILLCCLTAFTQGFDSKARAYEILKQTRIALGGDAVLESVQSLSAVGNFRSGSGSTQASGDLELDILFPDMVLRSMKWSLSKEVKVTAVEGMNGRQVWRGSKEKYPGRAVGLGPIVRGSGSSEDRNTGEQSPSLIDNPDDQQIRSDFSCLTIALLLHLPDLAKAEISLDQKDEIGITADYLKIEIGEGTRFGLAIDRKTHLPVMASYDLLPQREKDGKSEMLPIQIYFSEYKPVPGKRSGDLRLPHQITKTRNGVTVEDMHITKFQLNPHLKPKQFEQKHS